MINGADLITFDFGQLIELMQSMGVVCEQIPNSEIIKVSYKHHVEYLVDDELPYIPLGYKNIINDKFFLKQILIDIEVPVQAGNFFQQTELEEALKYIDNELGWPVVVKPTSLGCGNLVFCAIQDEATLRKIWQENILDSRNGPFIVEKCWAFCPDYRFVIFPGQTPYVVKRTVPSVVGDGKHTIQQLVDIENTQRTGLNRSSLCSILFTEAEELRCLTDQGYTLSDIPSKGTLILLKYLTNLSQGGMSEIIDTELVHPTYWPIFQKVWALFPELPLLSLDILSFDISKPATSENMVVCEAHISPGLGMFFSPGKGTGINLFKSLVYVIFPELSPS